MTREACYERDADDVADKVMRMAGPANGTALKAETRQTIGGVFVGYGG